MTWKVLGKDRKVEIIVDPDFQGDLLALATRRPVWIVETPLNQGKIEAVWAMGSAADLYYVNKYLTVDPTDRANSLIATLDAINEHHGAYAAGGGYDGIIVHGLSPSSVLREKLAKLGFEITEAISDGFVAVGTLSEPVYLRQFSEI